MFICLHKAAAPSHYFFTFVRRPQTSKLVHLLYPMLMSRLSVISWKPMGALDMVDTSTMISLKPPELVVLSGHIVRLMFVYQYLQQSE